MSGALPSLGEMELRVLRLVWEHQPCAERTVSDLIQEQRPVGRTTVLKTIQRLEAKGLLKRVPHTRPVQFRAAIDERRLLPQLVGRFVDGVLGGSAEPFVAWLADSRALSAKDLEALRGIARKISQEQNENHE